MSRKLGLLSAMLAVALMAGCSAGQSSSQASGNGGNTGSKAENDVKNVELEKYSLIGKDITLVDKAAKQSLDNDDTKYSLYTDGVYDYYFDEDMSNLRSVVDKDDKNTEQLRKVENNDYLGDAVSYINITSPQMSVSKDDFKIDDSSSDVVKVSLVKSIQGEKLSVATFYYTADKLTGLNLDTDVLTSYTDDTKLLDKEEAIKLADKQLEDVYGDVYTSYCSEADTKLQKTIELNTHSGKLYWYETVSNGEYGGFVSEIDAITGEKSRTDQIK